MQYKCEFCQDTGSLNKFGPYYDCAHCDAADQRVALEKWCSETQQRGPSFDDCWAIHQRALAMAPKQGAPAVAFDAATFIENKAAAYLDENSSTDPDDGSTIFHYGSAGSEYYNGLVELAEEIRLAAPAVANGALTDEQINWHTKNIYGTAATAQEVEFAKSILAAAGPDAALADLLIEVSDVLAEQNWRGDLQERLRDVAALSGAKGN